MLSCFFRNRVFLFLWAVFCGFLFGIVFKQYEQTIHDNLTFYRITPSSFNYQWAYRTWLSGQGLYSSRYLEDRDLQITPEPEAQWLKRRIPILCVILSKKIKQSRAVKETWAKHCNRVMFFGEFQDNSIPVSKIKTKDGNWRQLCEVLRAVWKDKDKNKNTDNGNSKINWVLFVTDRTYAIVENLRYMVAGLDWNESLYLGHTYRDYERQYNVRDAGYVLSWGAMTVLGERFHNSESCVEQPVESSYWHDEGERTLGRILQSAGINCRDTRDVWEKSRFLQYNIEKLLIPGSISVFSNYWRQSAFLSPEGSGCCSDFVITLSDVTVDKMYMFEYIVYHLKPVSNHWPMIEPSETNKNRSKEKWTSKPATTSTKRVPVGKAFIADISIGHKKKIVVESPPHHKDEIEIEIITAKNTINGHMNKVADFVLEEDDDEKRGVRKPEANEEDDFSNNEI